MIQFVSLLMIYYETANLSDWMFLYIDLIILDSIAVTISLNRAYKTLSKTRPPKSLMDGRIMVSMFFQVIIQGLFQFTFVYLLKTSMTCYRSGLILPGAEFCACPNILNRTQPLTPDFPLGNFTFSGYQWNDEEDGCINSGEDADCTICQPPEFKCTLAYANGVYNTHSPSIPIQCIVYTVPS